MKTDDYRVSVYYTYMPIPFSFAVHCHVVAQHNEYITRYDVFDPITGLAFAHSRIRGHVYKNAKIINAGAPVIPFHSRASGFFRFNAHEYSTTSGGVDSPAHKLYSFIVSENFQEYPECYNMILGPNSNTFIQWIVDQVPEVNLKLPWNAWGKGYKVAR